ncbi:Arabinogalactan peptide 16 [Acorus calamus]|uniref:Arabinogalactan peptide 16 n=1 Tax=Acorus calamus TaxID=4465 RepID=A0AAV9ECU7_ACOCL|nr:Arabinogalactan peptide 16 [Acorus calamus]
MSSIKSVVFINFAFFSSLMQLGHGQPLSPNALASEHNDGTTIDQGIAYMLMLMALVVTYLVH